LVPYLPRLHFRLRQAAAAAAAARPDVLLTIDSKGFNLRLAARVRALAATERRGTPTATTTSLPLTLRRTCSGRALSVQAHSRPAL